MTERQVLRTEPIFSGLVKIVSDKTGLIFEPETRRSITHAELPPGLFPDNFRRIKNYDISSLPAEPVIFQTQDRKKNPPKKNKNNIVLI